MKEKEAKKPESRYRSRKFLLACWFTLVGTVALFGGQISGSEFVALATLVLAAYGASNVMQARQQ